MEEPKAVDFKDDFPGFRAAKKKYLAYQKAKNKPPNIYSVACKLNIEVKVMPSVYTNQVKAHVRAQTEYEAIDKATKYFEGLKFKINVLTVKLCIIQDNTKYITIIQ